VPVAVKDNIALAGCPPRNGSAATGPEPAAVDDELVRRLREAGALLVGKTKRPELGCSRFPESEASGAGGGRGGGGRESQRARAGPVAVHRERGLRGLPQPLEPRPHPGRLLGRQ